MATYLDGARLWNASVASGVPAATLAAPLDLVSVALSKGLGAPGGSVMAGSRELIVEATRHRRIFGGAMRQTGIYAAAALFSIDHHLEQLAADHGNAAALAQRLAASRRIALDMATVQTNIVMFRVADGAPDAATLVSRAKEKGVLLFAFGPRTLRAVTHLDVTRAHCEQAGEVLAGIAES
jgi:threonine aldolase